ncbi:MAG: exodeoxyribonuclease VII large subunit [Parcubacteria group bacterium]|jgi:exodeoxyribonuclease VII large subunit
MQKKLLEKLKNWRDKTARRSGVEFYRVLGNQALEEIAAKMPQNKQELLEIKGIKEKKYAQYGEEILSMVRGEGEEFVQDFKEENKVFEVGEYLDFLNEKLLEAEARVKGEVSSVDIRGNYIFFGIKDKGDESLINCFIWRNDYEASGVELEEGMEIVIWGYPSVYKPGGRLSFQTKMIELVGEGALKKAYDELKRKLEGEGLFALERKRAIPDFVQKIGLITSHQGAAIGDFTSNLGSYGFQIKFFDSRVEGKQAVFDLINGIKWFNRNMPEIGVIVLVRGGGSFESLQAFNSESLVREVAASKIPILAGIGHEQDITLAALTADKMVSTPTGAAVELSRCWDEAARKVDEAEHQLLANLSGIFERFERVKHALHREAEKIGQAIFYGKDKIRGALKNIYSDFSRSISGIKEQINVAESQIKLNDPERQLRLGYSLVSHNGKIVRSVKDVEIGDEMEIQIADGKFESEVKKIYNL